MQYFLAFINFLHKRVILFQVVRTGEVWEKFKQQNHGYSLRKSQLIDCIGYFDLELRQSGSPELG